MSGTSEVGSSLESHFKQTDIIFKVSSLADQSAAGDQSFHGPVAPANFFRNVGKEGLQGPARAVFLHDFVDTIAVDEELSSNVTVPAAALRTTLAAVAPAEYFSVLLIVAPDRVTD